jgi:hypothetical protein
MSWPAVIVLAAVASCAVVLMARYFLLNRKTRATAGAARPDPSVTLLWHHRPRIPTSTRRFMMAIADGDTL